MLPRKLVARHQRVWGSLQHIGGADGHAIFTMLDITAEYQQTMHEE